MGTVINQINYNNTSHYIRSGCYLVDSSTQTATSRSATLYCKGVQDTTTSTITSSNSIDLKGTIIPINFQNGISTGSQGVTLTINNNSNLAFTLRVPSTSYSQYFKRLLPGWYFVQIKSSTSMEILSLRRYSDTILMAAAGTNNTNKVTMYPPYPRFLLSTCIIKSGTVSIAAHAASSEYTVTHYWTDSFSLFSSTYEAHYIPLMIATKRCENQYFNLCDFEITTYNVDNCTIRAQVCNISGDNSTGAAKDLGALTCQVLWELQHPY